MSGRIECPQFVFVSVIHAKVGLFVDVTYSPADPPCQYCGSDVEKITWTNNSAWTELVLEQ